MKVNEGMLDRTLRIAIGVGLLLSVFIGPQTSWGWLGLIPLVTGVLGFCPLYVIIGLNTCQRSKIRR